MADQPEKPYLPPLVVDLLVRVEAGDSLKKIAADTNWSWWAIRRRAATARDLLGVTRYTVTAARRARELGLLPEAR